MSSDAIYLVTTWAIPVIVAITFHEAAHGFVAHLLGDDTAWRLGRVSFNPVKHIDPLWDDPIAGHAALVPRAVSFWLRQAGASQFSVPPLAATGHGAISWPKAEEASRAVREYLTALDAAQNHAESSEDDDKFNGGSRRKPPKEVSLTDPQAAWVARKNTDPFFAYDANYLIDNKAGIIVDAEGTRASRIAEIAITRTMLDRVGGRFDLRPQRLAGDTVYGAVRLLKWLVDRKITPHIPVWDKSTRSDGTFSRADFVFDRERNVYICPGGKLLHTTGTVIDGGTLRYRASKVDCDVCAFKMRCCPSTPMRYVPRDLPRPSLRRVKSTYRRSPR